MHWQRDCQEFPVFPLSELAEEDHKVDSDPCASAVILEDDLWYCCFHRRHRNIRLQLNPLSPLLPRPDASEATISVAMSTSKHWW